MKLNLLKISLEKLQNVPVMFGPQRQIRAKRLCHVFVEISGKW